MAVEIISYVILYVRDLEASAAFYRDVVGLLDTRVQQAVMPAQAGQGRRDREGRGRAGREVHANH